MKVALTSCYILHERSYRESSLILEIFSREHGRLALVAKGAKKRKSGIRYLMQPNRRLNLAWNIRGEMGTLTSIEPDGTPYLLQGRWLVASFYLNELLIRLLHRHEAHQELFDAYSKALLQLSSGKSEQLTLRVFEKVLLQSLGYGLVLDHDVVSGEPINKELDYHYQLDRGPMIQTPTISEYIEVSGETLQDLDNETLSTRRSLKQAKHLMSATLKKHLGTKPLASRELYKSYLAIE